MRPHILWITPLLAVTLLGALLVTLLLGHGENASTALDEYTHYLPGNPVPTAISCDLESNFFDEYLMRCHVEGGTYCQFGQIMAYRGVIAQATFYMCRFPVAYLTAEYGHYRSAQRFNRSTILRWYSVNAQVSSMGWLDNMQPVHTVTWWRPDELADEGL